MGPFFTMCVASPIAFLLWSFRNSDKRIDQLHVEENIRQSDFHMLEQWATTNEKGESLQVAAIYQLQLAGVLPSGISVQEIYLPVKELQYDLDD